MTLICTENVEIYSEYNMREKDYLNHEPSVAKEYESLKLSLASQAPVDSGRKKYTSGKHDFIVYTLRKALVKSYLGKAVDIKIDRPMGSRHPRYPEMIYPVCLKWVM